MMISSSSIHAALLCGVSCYSVGCQIWSVMKPVWMVERIEVRTYSICLAISLAMILLSTFKATVGRIEKRGDLA